MESVQVDVEPSGNFLDEVAAIPGGETLVRCLQCGSCGGSCPSAADMDHTPRQLFAMIMENMRDQVLRSNTPWYCVSCYYCTVRCPQEIPITDIMYGLKRMGIREGLYRKPELPDFSKTFISFVERYGRSFELGLATRYHLTHHPLGKLDLATMGLEMLQKGRFSPRPHRIRRIKGLQAIVKRAKELSAADERRSQR